MSKKDNVIMFPTKAKVPDTLTISFGDSEPVTYTLSADNIDLSGLDTITVNIPDNIDWNDCMYSTGWHNFGDSDTITVTVTDPVEMLEAEMVRQMELDFDKD